MKKKIKKYINDIVNTRDSIEMHKTTILVGENGTGKSMVRKQLGLILQEKTNNKNARVASVSMQTRTGVDMCGMHLMTDRSWDPTSIHTNYLIQCMFKSNFNNKEYDKKHKIIPYYFIIDEPEVGMSRESQLALCNYLKTMIPEVNIKSYGMLIITHSEFIVEQLKDVCEFKDLNNSDRTADEWINREIIPTDFEQLKKDTHELFNELLPKNK